MKLKNSAETQPTYPRFGAVKGLLIGTSITAAMALAACGPNTEKEATIKSDTPSGMKSKKVDLKGDIASVKRPRDTDGDGIADSDDKCPTVKGVASEKGCPEKKEPVRLPPGVPPMPKAPANQGSAVPVNIKTSVPMGVKDTDGDGVPDSEDQCPTRKGPASNKGCPRLPGGRTRPTPPPPMK
ncbi:thrombospondin type 3 repeat-containing protein [Myxococcota bacterium]|nr:thrombospondin type 3 repeat-containing protein [Myxococcota bacterium]MBU1536100.1 thrombospondin type 3 repeat-containing protein [Myxococcota bacterium]